MADPTSFRRAGRSWQPCLDDGYALAGLLELERALWVATGAPVATIRGDPGFLGYLDADGDGRIRADEVCAAVRWTLASLVDAGDIRAGNTSTALDRLAPGAAELRAAARAVLAQDGVGEAGVLTLEAVRRQALVGAWSPGAVGPELRALCEALAGRFDQYFTLCRASRVDPTVVDRALPVAEQVDLLEPAALAAWIARAPMAQPRPDGLLVLRTGINPADEALVCRLRREVLRPMLGTQADTLDQPTWEGVLQRVRAHPGSEPDAGSAGHAAGAALGGVRQLERLLLFQAYLLPFVNGFVSCRDLYDPRARSMFGWGTLVLDGRKFTLAVKVPDADQHEGFTRRGALCVLYVQVGERDGTWDYEVAVPVTTGRRGLLLEGTWGLFVEHDGRTRHARVRRVILHPISTWDALVSPFRRGRDALEAAFDKPAAVGDPEALARELGTPAVPKAALPGAAPATKPGMPTGMVALAAGAGIALAAISSALTYMGDRLVAAASTIGDWVLRLRPVATLPPGPREIATVIAYPGAVLFVILVTLLVVVVHAVPQALKAHDLEQGGHPLAPLSRRDPPDREPERDVLGDRHVSEQRVVLEHEPDLAVPGVQVVHALAVEPHLPGVCGLQPGDHPQHGALPTPRGPEQRDQLPGLHLEADVVHYLGCTEALDEVLDANAHDYSRSRWRRSRSATAAPASRSAMPYAAGSWRSSIALWMNVVAVWVRLATDPPTTSTAPNSPRARAAVSVAPTTSAPRMFGSVT